MVTGPNGSGKSNLHRALRLLADTAEGRLIPALAREGGIPSVAWAGPQEATRRFETGELAITDHVQDAHAPLRLRLGFADEDLGYAIVLGRPVPVPDPFSTRTRRSSAR